MIALNQTINWVPEHVQDGRFGNWLTELKDWALGRERYWGTTLPIWVDDQHRRDALRRQRGGTEPACWA